MKEQYALRHPSGSYSNQDRIDTNKSGYDNIINGKIGALQAVVYNINRIENSEGLTQKNKDYWLKHYRSLKVVKTTVEEVYTNEEVTKYIEVKNMATKRYALCSSGTYPDITTIILDTCDPDEVFEVLDWDFINSFDDEDEVSGERMGLEDKATKDYYAQRNTES